MHNTVDVAKRSGSRAGTSQNGLYGRGKVTYFVFQALWNGDLKV